MSCGAIQGSPDATICAIAVSAKVLVDDSVCCGVNIGRQFPLTADICAMVVVFGDVCSHVSTMGKEW